MGRFMKPLTADIHFYTAMLDETPVVVFIEDELIGCGKIEEIRENSIKVGDEWFMRGVCIIKYANS